MPFEQSVEDLVAVGEEPVERRVSDPRAVGDRPRRRGVDTVLVNDRCRRIEDPGCLLYTSDAADE